MQVIRFSFLEIPVCKCQTGKQLVDCCVTSKTQHHVTVRNIATWEQFQKLLSVTGHNSQSSYLIIESVLSYISNCV